MRNRAKIVLSCLSSLPKASGCRPPRPCPPAGAPATARRLLLACCRSGGLRPGPSCLPAWFPVEEGRGVRLHPPGVSAGQDSHVSIHSMPFDNHGFYKSKNKETRSKMTSRGFPNKLSQEEQSPPAAPRPPTLDDRTKRAHTLTLRSFPHSSADIGANLWQGPFVWSYWLSAFNSFRISQLDPALEK